MRVNINAGGRDVTIETSDTNVTPDSVAAKALELWQATSGPELSEGPAFGFVPQLGSTPSGYANLSSRPMHVASGQP